MKVAYIDIGELGWSLYLSANIRWHSRHTKDEIAVITYPDRKCLYQDSADMILDIPSGFDTTFDLGLQSCLGLKGVSAERIKAFFQSHIPLGFKVPWYPIGKTTIERNLIFEPYKYSEKLDGCKEILVFPRHRTGADFRLRNLPESFYVNLIKKLCVLFPNLTIRTIGTRRGSYDISSVTLPNYENWVGKGKSLQNFIDRCQLAVAAIGAQSAPPKISLLQGVPTFMIGHEPTRHVRTDNWMKTKAGFYLVGMNFYHKINSLDCINKVVEWIKECV